MSQAPPLPCPFLSAGSSAVPAGSRPGAGSQGGVGGPGAQSRRTGSGWAEQCPWGSLERLALPC